MAAAWEFDALEAHSKFLPRAFGAKVSLYIAVAALAVRVEQLKYNYQGL